MKITAVLILIGIKEYSVLILASTTLFTEPLTWNDANQYCKSIGQHLLTIDRQAKQQLLHKALLDMENITSNFEDDIWIGLHAPDPNKPTNRVWTNNCFASNSFSNWSPGLSIGNDNLCTYVDVEDENIHWHLAECGTDTRPFICESDAAICNDGFSYGITIDTRLSTGLNESYQLNPGTEKECTDACSVISVCWAFLFIPSVPKCVMYDEYDGPFQTENDRIPASGEDLYTKRLNEDTDVVSVPPYDDCGSVVVSDCVFCVTTMQVTTTQSQKSTQIETISFKVSSADKTTETTLPTTTEPHMTSTVEVTLSDLPVTTSQPETTSTEKTSVHQTPENVLTSALEVTTSHVHTTTLQPETTTLAKSSIFPTTQKKFTTNTTGKTPYCVCACNNVTKQISLQESINEIVNEIQVDTSKTSSYTRKHTSAWDSRKSSASIGIVGIAILISIASLLLCLDSTSLIYRVFALLRKTGTS
ncbi:unnamed protein product [Mytilus coruscus]|uniref:C-type lectin domain-containing protein n=1 Tax=Mytilus coruscus TaxID=42192 RepID=A0A6J8C1W0_MYTCO|nr:unnamed protein product [Mytilus coruscus]